VKVSEILDIVEDSWVDMKDELDGYKFTTTPNDDYIILTVERKSYKVLDEVFNSSTGGIDTDIVSYYDIQKEVFQRLYVVGKKLENFYEFGEGFNIQITNSTTSIMMYYNENITVKSSNED
jgi:hypothetical protein